MDKLDASNRNKTRWTGQWNKTKRILADQIPLVKAVFPGSLPKFIFPGVQTIKWTMARDITEQYGLQSFTMLPWYTKAVAITITGKSYLGAFATDLTAGSGVVNTSLQWKGVVEYIRDEMREMDGMLSGVNVVSGGGAVRSSDNTSLVSSLAVGLDGEGGSIKVLGFIKSFEVEEEVGAPFVQKYTLQYLGVDLDWYAQSRARNRFGKDNSIISSPVDKIKYPNG
jgi:hypothetical protein